MTSHKEPNFECAVITGAGGGIGYALAQWLISSGKKVILVGRTESNLKSASKSLGKSTPYYVLDTGKTKDIPAFVQRVVKEHPEIDCLINNAGVQRPLKILDSFDLDKADQEIDINIRGPMHLTMHFLPHLKTKSSAVVVNVSSVLGFNPTSVINPVYNGTKAWLHFWTMNLRTQLKNSGIKVIEIAPPMVGTDLHREREDPDDNKKEKNSIALTVEEFMEEVKQQFGEGKDIITAGPGKKIVSEWYGTFGEGYSKVNDAWEA